MTDYICELDDGRILAEYVDDGVNEVVLVSRKASIYHRKYRIPREVEKAVRMLEKI